MVTADKISIVDTVNPALKPPKIPKADIMGIMSALTGTSLQSQHPILQKTEQRFVMQQTVDEQKNM